MTFEGLGVISESIARIRSQVKVLHAGRLCPTQAAVDLSSAALPRDPRTKAKWQEIKAESTGQCRFDFLQSIDVKFSQKPGIYNTFQREPWFFKLALMWRSAQ